jgi:molybdenum cofactor cytidylyltransferase
MPTPIILLLAAGHGQRWKAAGGKDHKLTAPLAGSTVFAHALSRAIGSKLEVRACIAPSSPAPLAAMCRMLGVPVVPVSGGMGEVIAQAVRAVPSPGGWLILPADLPCVTPATVKAVAQALATGALTARPSHQDTPGHPVGFAAKMRSALVELNGDAGARAVLLAHPPQVIEVADAGILLDIDTPEDLRRAEDFLRHPPG